MLHAGNAEQRHDALNETRAGPSGSIGWRASAIEKLTLLIFENCGQDFEVLSLRCGPLCSPYPVTGFCLVGLVLDECDIFVLHHELQELSRHPSLSSHPHPIRALVKRRCERLRAWPANKDRAMT